MSKIAHSLCYCKVFFAVWGIFHTIIHRKNVLYFNQNVRRRKTALHLVSLFCTSLSLFVMHAIMSSLLLTAIGLRSSETKEFFLNHRLAVRRRSRSLALICRRKFSKNLPIDVRGIIEVS